MNKHPSNRRPRVTSALTPTRESGSAVLPEVDALKLLHELQVHQVELAQQNEELEAARADLEASAQRYFSLYESAPVGLVTLSRRSVVREVNSYGRELLGDDDGGLAGACLLDRLSDTSCSELERALAAPVSGQTRRSVQISVSAAATERRILRAEIRPHPAGDDSMLLALTDITEQRRSEDELAHTREVLELSNRVARIGYWQINLDTNVATWSAVAREIYEMQPDAEPKVDAFLDSCKDDQSRERFRLARSAAVERGATFDLELQIATCGGRARWIRITGKAETTSGLTPRLYGTVQDIDAHVQAQSARMAQAGAEMANRSKNAFLARMSHDLRTPLNAVLGFSELLQLNGVAMASPGVADQVRHIHDAGEHLLAMIDEVLDLARIESGDLRIAMERVEMSALIGDCMTLVAPSAAADAITLHAPSCKEVQAALGDRTRLRQVLMNLLSNAVKYNRHGGSVEIDVNGDADHVTVAVRDRGQGLSPEQLGELFQPFNRLGAELRGIEGTGLGLVIAKQLVEAMGGSLNAESTVGVGSVFTLRLQRAEDGHASHLADALPIDVREDDSGAGAFVVLYVEDNPVNVELMRAAVALRHQVRIEVAVDGQAGLEMCRRLRPDLVLLDMGLPIMDGATVLAHLRADPELANIPCVAVSANAMDTDVKQALEAGFTDYIVKPFALPRLLALLDRMMANAQHKSRAALPRPGVVDV
jgi:signal transduction histidine kinase/AmiR/NasT family two-component response regulator